MVLQEQIKKVQNRGARFVTNNYYFETRSITGILGKKKKKKQYGSHLRKGGETVDSGGKYSKLSIIFSSFVNIISRSEQLNN